MDLVECGDVRRLFSDEELLALVAVEEEHERRATTGAHRNHTSREPTEAAREEAPALGDVGQGRPGTPTASKDEVCTHLGG